MTNDNRMNDKTVIIIDEKPDVIPGQPEGEVPVITIEDGGSPQTAQSAKMRRGRKWPTLVAAAIVAIMVCVCGFGGGRFTAIFMILVCLSAYRPHRIWKNLSGHRQPNR